MVMGFKFRRLGWPGGSGFNPAYEVRHLIRTKGFVFFRGHGGDTFMPANRFDQQAFVRLTGNDRGARITAG